MRIGLWVSNIQSFESCRKFISKLNRRYLQSRGLYIDPPASISGALPRSSVLTFLTFYQTRLATYFVTVDCLLVFQYVYYYKAPKRSLSVLGRIHSTTSPARMNRSVSRYRTLSVVASNVAAAAAAAAQQDGHRVPSARYSQPSDQHLLQERSSSRASGRLADGDPGYDDDGNLMLIADSYHSDAGRETNGKRVSWSIERHRDRAASVGRTPPALHALPIDPLPDLNLQSHGHSSNESLTPAASRRGSRASRRGSTMVFLGVWALFGIGTLTSKRAGLPISTNNDVGRVLVNHNLETSTPVYHSHPDDTLLSHPTIDELTFDPAFASHDIHAKPSSEQPLVSEQVLGRIFAWLCTTLYLTSRLPQIWKNVRDSNHLLKLIFSDTSLKYVRKSVEVCFPLHIFRT